MPLTNDKLEAVEAACQQFLGAATELRACLEENLGLSVTVINGVHGAADKLTRALEDLSKDGDDIVAVLERIALMAEVSNHHTPDGTMRLMPAAGVADVIYEAMHTIVDLRIDLEIACEDATEAETFAEELLDAEEKQ